MPQQVRSLMDIIDECSFPPPPPKLASGPCTGPPLSAKRFVQLAWLAECNGWDYANKTEANGTIQKELTRQQFKILSTIKGPAFAHASMQGNQLDKDFEDIFKKAAAAVRRKRARHDATHSGGSCLCEQDAGADHAAHALPTPS